MDFAKGFDCTHLYVSVSKKDSGWWGNPTPTRPVSLFNIDDTKDKLETIIARMLDTIGEHEESNRPHLTKILFKEAREEALKDKEYLLWMDGVNSHYLFYYEGYMYGIRVKYKYDDYANIPKEANNCQRLAKIYHFIRLGKFEDIFKGISTFPLDYPTAALDWWNNLSKSTRLKRLNLDKYEKEFGWKMWYNLRRGTSKLSHDDETSRADFEQAIVQVMKEDKHNG